MEDGRGRGARRARGDEAEGVGDLPQTGLVDKTPLIRRRAIRCNDRLNSLSSPGSRFRRITSAMYGTSHAASLCRTTTSRSGAIARSSSSSFSTVGTVRPCS